ncbi:helix-turn-helix transcriptional regulator [Streptomyces huiliensis]|uniref:helix-turn-helix transcriptional regulator n=1 Tax=Streptomyces huiliensis TaxID=2876027 RepID=UPI001CBDE511|nr:LuxR family transcriptional regulator [Streptomyces huiliensis]MBZ4317857.1 LuxR C-terminal-related transcriptional regulator [Streptomyces huiliensis]
MVIEGPKGAGKSHLLDVARCEAARLGLRVESGEDVLTRQDPHAGIVELGLGEEPFVVILDGVERLSEAASLLLASLIRRTGDRPVLWLLACRTRGGMDPAGMVLEEIAARYATRLPLKPLGRAALEEMGASVFGAAMEPRLAELVHRTAGAPWLVRLLLEALAEEGLVRVRSQRAGLRSHELPRRLVDAVALRINELSEDARQLVTVLAVFDRPCGLHEASALLGRPLVQATAAAHEALADGVLVERERGLDFCCPLVRDAAYAYLTEATRTALHRETALFLQRDGASAAEVARHIALGSRPGEDAVGRLVAFIERIGHAPQQVTDSVRLLSAVGHHEEARALVTRVLQESGSEGEGESGDTTRCSGQALKVQTLLTVASTWLHTGGNDGLSGRAVGLLDEAALPPAQRARLLAVRGIAHLCELEPEAAEKTARRALCAGEESGDLLSRLIADMTLSRCALAAGDLDQAVGQACEAMHLAHLGGRETAQHYPHLLMAPALVAYDELAEAETMLRLGEQQAARNGDIWLQPMWQYQRAQLLLASGRLRDAERAAEDAAACSEPRSPVGSAVLALLAHLALLRGHVSTARYHLRCAALGPLDSLDSAPEDLLWRRGLLQEAEGHLQVAFRTLRPLYGSLTARPRLLTREPEAAATLVRLARCAGAREQAATVVAVMRHLARRHPRVPTLQGAAMHAEAVLRDDPRLAETAHREERLAARPLALASALEDSGVLLWAGGESEQATIRLRQALCLYEKAGAGLFARRVRGRLSERAVQPTDTRQSPVPGWESLTESERRVGELVAQGLTNREVAKRLFLSPHTVDSHLRQCFAKFAVNNRVELTRAVLEHHNPRDPENT